MGVGYPLDIVVCVALGVDMFDCVYPTRTARFGVALTPQGTLRLKAKSCGEQIKVPVMVGCPCICCRAGDTQVSRAALHVMFKDNSELACQLLTQHNIVYMMRLMRTMRSAIQCGREAYISFIKQFLIDMFSEDNSNEEGICGRKRATEEGKPDEAVPGEATQAKGVDERVPEWVKDALAAAELSDVFPLR